MEEINTEAYEMFDLFEMTPDLVCIAGKDGYFRKVNPSVLNKLGYTEEELFSKPISSFIHPEDMEITARERERLLEGNPLLNFQNRYQTKNGHSIWLEWTSIYNAEKEIVFAIAKDVTIRKVLEIQIEEKYKKFKGLTSHFKNYIEEDKKLLAAELHEGLAQLAAVVKMDIDWIRQHLPEADENMKSRLDHALSVSEVLINTIKRISFDISPNMMDDLGLAEVIKWLCNQFTHLHQIPCQLRSSVDDTKLDREIKLDIFRICQEVLASLVDHASAKNIQILIKDTGNTINLSFTDDALGFDKEMLLLNQALNNIKERAATVNGVIKFFPNSEPGTGFSVLFEK